MALARGLGIPEASDVLGVLRRRPGRGVEPPNAAPSS
jgi:hypothetical protein